MAKKHTSILLNGKEYDARTGAVVAVHHTSAAKAATPVPAPKVVPLAARSMDGIASGTPARADRPARRLSPAAVHPVSSSKTLMRSAVKKPTQPTRLKRTSKTQVPVVVAGRQTLAAAPLARKISAAAVSEKRLAHAQKVSVHPKVSHFAPHRDNRIFSLVTEVEKEAVKVAQAVDTAVAPAVEPITHHVRAYAAPAQADVFTRALNNASAAPVSMMQRAPHPRAAQNAKRARKARRRMVSYASAAVAVLAVIGVLGYYNITSIQFQLARHQAGFAAVMPSYKPSGYRVTKIQSETDALAVSYQNGSKQFAINEQPSNWSGTDVLTNLVAGAPCTISEQHGRTVYLFADRGAWVSGGILYQVAGAISATDIGKIAASL